MVKVCLAQQARGKTQNLDVLIQGIYTIFAASLEQLVGRPILSKGRTPMGDNTHPIGLYYGLEGFIALLCVMNCWVDLFPVLLHFNYPHFILHALN